MDIIAKFFEIFNFRFWLLMFELFYFPFGLCLGGLFCQWLQKKRGSENEIQ